MGGSPEPEIKKVSKRFHYDAKKVRQIPAGEPFVQLSRELLASPAWRARSINTIRLIDFLMIEHMNHAGYENGRLMATYDQLVAFGIGRRFVHSAISEAEQLGLILVERGGRRGFTISHVNTFTLTFLTTKNKGNRGEVLYVSPTNNWKRINDADAEKIKNG